MPKSSTDSTIVMHILRLLSEAFARRKLTAIVEGIRREKGGKKGVEGNAFSPAARSGWANRWTNRCYAVTTRPGSADPSGELCVLRQQNTLI